MIRLVCSGCDKALQVKPTLLGRRVACPHCRHVNTVPVSEQATLPPTDPSLPSFARRELDGEAMSPSLTRLADEGAVTSPLEPQLDEASTVPASTPGADAKNLRTIDFTKPTAPDSATVRADVPGYEILDELGRGGMGVVYKARQISLGRIVALKMILGGGHAGSAELDRFRTEAESIARLQHPNIVQIHEIGQHDGVPYFSLEFCGGGSLEKTLAGTPLPPREAAALVEQLARAMQAAHDKGVIHRDLKPANVLLAEDGTPKITDFGLAKKLDEAGKTQAGSIMGTPSYMAPEQAGGKTKALGPACDIYALGAVLYECLTGRPPFRAATPLDTVMQVVTDEPVPPTQLNPNVPRDLETICLKCLQKEPKKRYRSQQALADDLKRFQADEPILARPVGSMERTVKWVKRRPVVAGLMAMVLLVAFLGCTGVSGGFGWALLERQNALDAEKSTRDEKEKVEIERNKALAAEKSTHDEKEKVEIERNKALAAEKEARDHLRNALFAQAQAGRFSSRAGQRFDSLAALAKAAEVKPSLELRNEAIACMTIADIRAGKEWDGFPPGSAHIAFDLAFERYARSDKFGNISVRRIADDVELYKLPGQGRGIYDMIFDPTGKYLAASYGGTANDSCSLWDLANGKKLFDEMHVDIGFTPDGARLVIAGSDGKIRFHTTPDGAEVKSFPGLKNPIRMRFHPQKDYFAICHSGGISVYKASTKGEYSITKLYAPHRIYAIAWQPNGNFVAGACADSKVYVWNASNGAQHAILEGHRHDVVRVHFSKDGSLLASDSWDGTMRLWDVARKKLILTRTGSALVGVHHHYDSILGFALDGTKIKALECVTSSECRIVADQRRNTGGWWSSIHRDGRLMAVPELIGCGLWDLQTGKRIGTLPIGSAFSTVFHPDGRSLITSGTLGFQRWPVQPASDNGAMVIGPPQKLPIAEPAAQFNLSRDGNWLAVRPAGSAVIYDLANGQRKFRVKQAGLGYADFSADGKWYVTGTWHGNDVKVWNAATGKLVKVLPMQKTAAPLFSPDGKWLLVRAKGYEFWDTSSWTMVHRIPRDTDVPGGAVFSRDGKRLFLLISQSTVTLLDPESKRELATLEAPETGLHGYLALSHDEQKLVRTDENLVHQIWDLALIRRQLATMNLDWDAPSAPAPQEGAVRPLTVKVEP